MAVINNALSDIQIKQIINKHQIKINGIYMKDKLPHKLKYGFYVINLQSSNEGNGSHWTGLYYHPHMSIYFDSFGKKPPQEVENRIGKYIYNHNDLQYINDTSCGYFCIAFIIFLYDKQDKYNWFQTFLNIFSKDLKKNNSILEGLINIF